MKCEEIMEKLETLSPKNYAEDWDNIGLLAGRRDKDVETIYIALDATDEVVEDAMRVGADLLLTHHPLIFKKLSRVNTDDFIGRRIVSLIQKDISYYALQTNCENFCVPSVRVFGDLGDIVEMAAVMPGSGGSYIKDAIHAGADVMITGDIDHHEGIDAVAQGLAVIDAGHYGIEKLFIPYMEEFIHREFPKLKVYRAEFCEPFVVR